MSPEQINEAHYNEKTDIWSAGCVLYEMVALRPPFEATNHLALAKKIISGTIERIPERYSEDLQEVIQSMLLTDPERRPSVCDLMKNQKIKLRLNERDMRDEYSRLKKRDQELNDKLEKMKKRDEEIKKREDTLKEREAKAQDLKFKLSHSSGFYKSIDN
jgi:NIMA (never in mitosis gene a)-related kinase